MNQRGVLIGLFIGFPVGAALFSAAALLGGSRYLKKRTAEASAGWNLIVVMVAARDLPEGTIVQPALLEERVVPEQLVTLSSVRPANAPAALGKPLAVELRAGDSLTWPMLVAGDESSRDACQSVIDAAKRSGQAPAGVRP